MAYHTETLPYKSFEQIGLRKQDVLNLPKSDLQQLLQGKTTSLMQLEVNSEGVQVKEKAKLSLYTLPDNSVGIKVHPIRKEIQNDYNLKAADIKRLQDGKAIIKQQTSLNGEPGKYLFKLDQETNEIKSIRTSQINIPQKLHGANLTGAQKDDLLKGKEVVVQSKNITKVVQIDLSKPKGYSVQEVPGVRREADPKKISKGKEEARGLGAEVERSARKMLEASARRTNGVKR